MSKTLATIDSSQLELAVGWSRRGFAAGTDGLIPLTSTELGLEAIDLALLDCVTGGQDVNKYTNLSNLVPHDPPQRRMSREQRLGDFLYGGYMEPADREALIRNWEESNGRIAPAQGSYELNLNGQWPQVVA
jgi:hypothetical protein